jgi:hypothetical protein
VKEKKAAFIPPHHLIAKHMNEKAFTIFGAGERCGYPPPSTGDSVTTADRGYNYSRNIKWLPQR